MKRQASVSRVLLEWACNGGALTDAFNKFVGWSATFRNFPWLPERNAQRLLGREQHFPGPVMESIPSSKQVLIRPQSACHPASSRARMRTIFESTFFGK